MADDKDGIKKSNFNPKWATKFIIHGFIDTPLSNWVSEMRDELIVRKNLNVIVVDWAGGSLPLYTQVSRIIFSIKSMPANNSNSDAWNYLLLLFVLGYSKYTIGWFGDSTFDQKVAARA